MAASDINDGKAAMEKLGFDRVPKWIIEKRVTELMDLHGKKAVVTGAGGTGLGRATANRLAGVGADVVLIDKNLEGAEKNAEEVRKRWGTKAFALQGDCASWDENRRFMREAHDKLGGIDILVNNPCMVDSGLFEEATEKQILTTVTGTLLMPVYGARAVLDYMIPQRSGRIINIASVGGRIAHKRLAFYDACKSGVIGFTRNLAHEVSHYGIYVLGVGPGIMINDRQETMFLNPTEENRSGRESILEGFTHVQLGRVSIPEEVANMVAYLCSDAASYMVGQTIDVAGGQHMD